MTTKADTTGLEYQSPEWFEACAAIKRGQLAGKTVQYICLGDAGGIWEEIHYPQWKEGFDYRLAPEPREAWLEYHHDGDPTGMVALYPKPGYVKFREVIE